MFNNYKKEQVGLTMQKLLFLTGIILCSIGLLMLIPLSKELAYRDLADSNALIFMITVSSLMGALAIFLSKRVAGIGH